MHSKVIYTHCLRHAGVSIRDIDCLAYYEEPQKRLERQLWMGLPQVPPVSRRALFRLDATRPFREIRDRLGYDGEVSFACSGCLAKRLQRAPQVVTRHRAAAFIEQTHLIGKGRDSAPVFVPQSLLGPRSSYHATKASGGNTGTSTFAGGPIRVD